MFLCINYAQLIHNTTSIHTLRVIMTKYCYAMCKKKKTKGMNTLSVIRKIVCNYVIVRRQWIVLLSLRLILFRNNTMTVHMSLNSGKYPNIWIIWSGRKLE
jgi:hypothetical protein